MVSKASEDLPEPESPVMTVRLLRGISTLIFFRLCCRAPRTTSLVRPMVSAALPPQEPLAHGRHTATRITFNISRMSLIRSMKGRAWNGKHLRFSEYRIHLTSNFAGVGHFFRGQKLALR